MASALTFLNRVPIAPVMAAMFAAAAAALVASTPQPVFEHGVASTGLAATLSIAKAPLGLKARLLAIVVAAAVAGLAAQLVGLLVERAISAPKRPTHRRHDDAFDLSPYAAPARPAMRAPIFADRELGAPLMSDEALATAAVPLGTEAPIEADHPVVEPSPAISLPDERPAVEAEQSAPALGAPLAFEEFDVPSVPEPTEPIDGETSIEALIRRLEAGLARRDLPRPPAPAAPFAPGASLLSAGSALRAVPGTPSDPDAPRTLDFLRRKATR